MNETKISWTDKTWSPLTGCRAISPGCTHCFARRFAERWRGLIMPNGKPHAYHNGFDLQFRPERLEQPGRWTKPSMIFVCSMSDLFQSRVPVEYLDQVFDAMEAADWHCFQVLTKRASRMRAYLEDRWAFGRPPAHIWVGVTAEDQERANQRLPQLRLTPARVRFVSAEPLLGPIQFAGAACLNGRGSLEGDIHQVICGGESGPGFRPMDLDWARAIRDKCNARSVSFFFKQHSGVRPRELGHLLDGVEWRELPRGVGR